MRYEQIVNGKMVSSGMLRSVALARTDVSEDLSASFIRVKRIGELGTTLAVTSNRSKLLTNCRFAVIVGILMYKLLIVSLLLIMHLINTRALTNLSAKLRAVG
jgi:hypothetical protein